MEYDCNREVDQFIDTIHSHSVFPTISLPTRITPNSATLIDNVLVSSNFKNHYTTGNLTVGISDHLPQFLIFKNDSASDAKSKNIFYRDWKSFHTEEFKNQFQSVDWRSIMKAERNDPNIAFENFYETLDNLFKKNLPIKKLTRNK